MKYLFFSLTCLGAVCSSCSSPRDEEREELGRIVLQEEEPEVEWNTPGELAKNEFIEEEAAR